LTGIGGFLQVFEYGYSGLRFTPTAVQLDPSLSPQLSGVVLNNLQWQGRTFTVAIGPQSTKVNLTAGPAMPVQAPSGDGDGDGGTQRHVADPSSRPAADQ
jgi:trehalose/maltose hydrolase-like predicted phosphorylase